MISTHILDTSKGSPAEKVKVTLELKTGTSWKKVDEAETNADGRAAFKDNNEAGTYRLLFAVEDYFNQSRTEAFFETIPVVFKITNTQRKYHVPLLLNPFGYSTYRGS